MSEIIFNSPPVSSSPLISQVENLQTTLASLNQQVIILQETLQERDQEILRLKEALDQSFVVEEETKPVDETVTIVGALIHLYKLLFLPGKAV